MHVPLHEWTALMDREYLDGFISGGGSAVKIAVTERDDMPVVREVMTDAAQTRDYMTVFVDAAKIKIHLIDQLFYAVSRQIDWDAEIDRFMRGLLNDSGILVADGQPLDQLDSIAAANGRDPRRLLSEINRLLENRVLKNRLLCREFRTALTMLCWGKINPQNIAPTDAELIKQWLLGEKCSLAALKRVQIFQRIGRHNARLMMSSLARWLHLNSYAGLILLADIDAVVTDYAVGINPVRYTKSALLDTYELLRQFIDSTNETGYLMTVVLATSGLLTDNKRNLDNYSAFKMRVVEDVRDKERDNPLNVLVRLECKTEVSQ